MNATTRQGRFGARDLGVLALYGMGVVFYTYPMATDFSRPFAPIGDYLLIAYGLTWQCHALLTDPASFFHANVMFPAPNALAIATPLNTSQLIFFAPGLALSGDPIRAINAVYWGNIFASACSAYWVLRCRGASRSAALVGGWIFGFAIGKAHQNFQFPFFWLVWVFHFWHGYLQSRQTRWLVAAVLAFVAMSLGSFYLMYMGFLGLVAWTVGFHVTVRSLFERRLGLQLVAGGVLAALLLLPFGLPYFSVSRTYGLKRPLGEAIQYSADPVGSYVLPSNSSVLYDGLSFGADYRPLPGEEALFARVADVVRDLAGASVLGQGPAGSELTYEGFHGIWRAGEGERRIFLGYSVLVLVALGLLARPPPRLRGERLLLAVAMIVSIVLSLGPVVVALGHLTYIPSPYALLYYLLPGLKGMRATARFGYVAMLAASALAAYGWWALEQGLRRWRALEPRRTRIAGMVVLAAWVGIFSLENLPASRVLHDRPPAPPPVYDWLRSAPVEGGIIEIPTFKGTMNKSDPVYGPRRIGYSLREYTYMFYSVNHWKPVYNGFGAFISPLQFQVRDAVERLPDRAAVAFLKGLELHTLVLHRYWFEAEDEEFWGQPEVYEVLEPIAEVGGAQVYRLR